MPVTNFKFIFRRLAFTVLLALEPLLLLWFKRLLIGFVALALFVMVAFWILIAPKSLQPLSVELEPLPPKLNISTLTLPPFSTLSEYAVRPVPVDDTQTLILSQ